MASRRKYRIFIIFMFFLTGSIMPLLNSVILNNSYTWKYGLMLKFSKPLFTNCLSFSGMALFAVPSVLTYIWARSRKRNSNVINWSHIRSASVPSILFIIASSLQNYAIIYVPVTVWQVFFGFQVLFTTLIAVTYMKQQLFLVDWLGLFVSVLGISIAGVSGLLRGLKYSQEDVSIIFFMFIILIFSHALKSLETILEEKLMHEHHVTGLQLTSLEGIWGFFIMSFIVLPSCNAMPPNANLGIYENTLESFEQLGSSTSLLISILFYIFLVAGFSYFGLKVTEMSSAIHRNMYEVVRPLTIWILSTATRIISNNKNIGEPIDNYSIIEMVGFLVCVVGSLIYNRVLRFPCFIYVDKDTNTNEDEESHRVMLVTSPLLQQ